jgi:hypothetical protein
MGEESTAEMEERKKPSEGAAERARAQAEVARDIARYLAEEANS